MPGTPDQPLSAPDSFPSRSLVLVGLMGAGKSVIGKRLAKRLGVPFHDSDAEIEKAAGRSINELFACFGEAAFRAGETRVIARLLDNGRCVLATGGGAFTSGETRSLIAQKALSIWLRADLDLLVSRTTGRTHRPLLNQGNLRETLERLMTERYPIYAQADLVVDTKTETPEATCRRIRAALARMPSSPAMDPAP